MGRIHGRCVEEKNQVKTTEVEFDVFELWRKAYYSTHTNPQMNCIQMQINPLDLSGRSIFTHLR